MFELIFFCFIIYIVLKRNSNTFIDNKLNTLFKVHSFSNVSTHGTINGIKFISANARGDNHLFALKNNSSLLSISDINKIYEIAQKLHIHNIIIVSNSISFANNISNKIKEYGIQIWDNKKIDSLIFSPQTSDILQTSNTSDDKCKIETNQFDPIQEPTSFFKNILKKPDRL